MFQLFSSLARFKIHHPLPLNPRESQQLLNLLKASFRNQLDREYGTPFKQHGEEAFEPRREKARQYSAPSNTTSRPTDRHLYSILNNPLFSHIPKGCEGLGTRRAARDPMDIFKDGVAQGLMKIEYARACLEGKLQQIISSPVFSLQEGMKESGAGLEVLRWLVSSGAMHEAAFLEDLRFTKLLTDFLVAEGHQEVVWAWVQKSLDKLSRLRGPVIKPEIMDSHGIPLFYLLKQEILVKPTLDSAYDYFSQAAKYVHSRCGVKHMIKCALVRSGMLLAFESRHDGMRRQSPSPEKFDTFVRLLPLFTNKHYHEIHLRLHHPTKPDVAFALKYLESFVSQGTSALAKPQQTALIEICLDTATYLLAHRRQEEARWVLEFIQTEFSDQIPMMDKQHLESARSEARSMELLENLSFA